MSQQQASNVNVLGVNIPFKPGTDIDRVQAAAQLLAEKFEDQQSRSWGAQSKEVLLIFIALGLADELLQLKKNKNEAQERLQALLAKIEKSL